MHRLRTRLIGAAAALLVLPAGMGSAAASDDDHDHGIEVSVIASGLDNPRGLALSQRGDLYIAQAGRGGDGPCILAPEGGLACLGATGKISKLRVDGHGKRHGSDAAVIDVVTGLPSLGEEGTGNNALGPTDLTFDRRGKLLATFGLGANPAVITADPASPGGGLGDSQLARGLASVNVIDTKAGTATKLADIGAFEHASNPDEGLLDTNPYAIAAGGRHRVVADAGGNALLAIGRDASVETLAVFPNEAPVQNPFAPPGVMIKPQAVPNAVVRGPDGAFYVGQLTGFPFVPGTATVWRVKPGEAPTVYADGFTSIIDLAFTDKGNLLVLEIARDGLFGALVEQNGQLGGALIEVSRKDTSQHTTLLADPLFAPGGLVVDDDDIYVSNRVIFAGGGEILKVTLGH